MVQNITQNKVGLFPKILAISFFLIFLLKIYYDSALNRCYGIFEIFRDLGMLIILYLILALLVFQLIYRLIAKRKALNVNVILIFSMGVLLAFTHISAGKWKDWRLSNKILSAKNYPQKFQTIQLILLENNHYYVEYGDLDWACSFIGTYVLTGDNLLLKGNKEKRCEAGLADKFLINEDVLEPVMIEVNSKECDLKTLHILESGK